MYYFYQCYINGNVYIGKGTFIGSGAIISNDISIGSGSVIGAGVVIKKVYLTTQSKMNSKKNNTIIIAGGVNHNGSLKKAKQLALNAKNWSRHSKVSVV